MKTFPFNSRRLGQFSVASSQVGFLTTNTTLFMDAVILEAKYNIISDRMEYTVASPKLREVSTGQMCPEYTLVLDLSKFTHDRMVVSFQEKL